MSDLASKLIDAAAEAVAGKLSDETGGCHCDPAFSERGRTDPGCVYCQAGGNEFGLDAGREAAAAVLPALGDHREPLSNPPVTLPQLIAEVRGSCGATEETP